MVCHSASGHSAATTDESAAAARFQWVTGRAEPPVSGVMIWFAWCLLCVVKGISGDLLRLSLLRIDSNVDIATGAECVGFASESVVV